jgi:hypothetical protein
LRRVIAVDVSPVMLDLLHGKVGRRHSTTSTSSTPAFYEHAGEPADIIYSRYALHHLPDMWKASALTRLRSILRPEGLLRLWGVVYDFGFSTPSPTSTPCPSTTSSAGSRIFCGLGALPRQGARGTVTCADRAAGHRAKGNQQWN